MAILLNTCKILNTSKTKNMKSYFFSSKNKKLKYIKLCEMLTVAEMRRNSLQSLTSFINIDMNHCCSFTVPITKH